TDLPTNVAVFGFVLQVLQDFLYERIESRHLEAWFLTADLGKTQQILDQSPHLMGTLADALQIFFGFRFQLWTTRFPQQIGKTLNVAERSTQIVSHRISKCFQLLIGSIEFRGTLRYTLL